MGRVEISEIIKNNPPYEYYLSPALRYKNSGYPPKILNNGVGCFADYREQPYWSINYDGDHDILPSSFNDLESIELQCKFIIFNNPSYMQELFSLCGVFTPDIETSNKLGFWDSANSQYWLEQPFNIKTWYWLKLYYDVATYTQTWSISTDGVNFTTIGTHTENRTDLQPSWDGTNTHNSVLYWGCIYPGNNQSQTSVRSLTDGYIDMNETWIKTNGILRCKGYLEGS